MSVDIVIGDRRRQFSNSGFHVFLQELGYGHVFDGEDGEFGNRFFLFRGERIPALGSITVNTGFTAIEPPHNAHLSILRSCLTLYKRKNNELSPNYAHVLDVAEWIINAIEENQKCK